MRVTEEEWQEILRKRGGRPTVTPETKEMVREITALASTANPVKALDARAPYRSKLEAAYASYLDTLIRTGEIIRYSYEPIRLNLAPKTTLTPDFLVITQDGAMEFHETKGFARDDAMAKLKIAARLYPWWRFWLVKKKRGIWDLRELPI